MSSLSRKYVYIVLIIVFCMSCSSQRERRAALTLEICGLVGVEPCRVYRVGTSEYNAAVDELPIDEEEAKNLLSDARQKENGGKRKAIHGYNLLLGDWYLFSTPRFKGKTKKRGMPLHGYLVNGKTGEIAKSNVKFPSSIHRLSKKELRLLFGDGHLKSIAEANPEVTHCTDRSQ